MDPRLKTVRSCIREIPDFPKPGILFYDITPILGSPPAFQAIIDLLAERYHDRQLDHIVAVESRGFLFAAPLSLRLKVPLHLVRKPGKLPWTTEQVSYSLEYGTSTLEIQHDDITKGGKTLIVDDLLATGGTVAAAAELVAGQGGDVIEAAFVIELHELKGRDQLGDLPHHALLTL